jgi:hypothetical protein
LLDKSKRRLDTGLDSISIENWFSKAVTCPELFKIELVEGL